MGFHVTYVGRVKDRDTLIFKIHEPGMEKKERKGGGGGVKCNFDVSLLSVRMRMRGEAFNTIRGREGGGVVN